MLARKYNIIRKIHLNVIGAFSSPDVKEEKIKIGKHEINYIKVGHGANRCILTPGGLGTIWSHYKHQIEGFDWSKFTLVVWEPPGFGKSCPPLREFSSGSYEHDADVGHELMTMLNIPRYSVLGWSAGGSASLILAAKYPGAVTKLVVWGTNAFILPSEIAKYRAMKDVNAWTKRLREPMEEAYGREWFAQYWERWVDGMSAVLDAKPDICSEFLKDIKCPTLVLHGAKDPLVDQIHAPYLIENIKNSVLHVYSEGKHDIHVQYPEDFNRTVQDFLLQPTQE